VNPVLQALANARQQDHEREHAMVAKAVTEKLGLSPTIGDKSRWPLWTAWCRAKGIDHAFPVRPHVLAVYLIENEALGIGELMRVVDSVSAFHVHQNASDPTLSPLVTAALDRVSPINPPRSWDAEHRAMWQRLPRDLQIYAVAREQERDRALKQQMSKQQKDSKNGIHHKDAPSAAGTTDA
jgi:hypothetical protein